MRSTTRPSPTRCSTRRPSGAASEGHDVLRGPASFSVNDECGLLVDGFDTPPTLMMPHNPRYYVTLLERAGFAKAKDLWVYQGGQRSATSRSPSGWRAAPS